MSKSIFDQIDKCAELSKHPLDNSVLEQFQQKYFADFRHYYYRFFYHLVTKFKPKVAIEIGIQHGHGCVHMAAGNLSTLVVGIDKQIDCARKAPKLPNLRFIYENSLSLGSNIESIVKQYGDIGLVFQDSSHYYNLSQQEFKIYSKYLDKNAIWACDDITPDFYDPLAEPPSKSMVEYFDELPGEKKKYTDLHHGSVIGITLL